MSDTHAASNDLATISNGHAAAKAGVGGGDGRGIAADPGLEFKLAWEYAPAPETAKVAIADRYGLFIDGRWVAPLGEGTKGHRDRGTKGKRGSGKGPGGDAPGGGAYFATVNPATEAVLSEVAQGTAADVDAAVKAARKALPKWSRLPASERAKFLYRIARRIQERARELAVLETMDGGKPIRESRDIDVPLAAQHFFYHAGWCDKLAYAFPGAGGGGGAGGPRPVGVCGQIIPWNFPLLMAAWKLAPALACGNTCVLKPAETTPLTALRLAEIMQEVGLPPGVVNVVTGDGVAGAALVEHAGVDKIAFTGSTEVGKRIAAVVAHGSESRATKKLTLELGGKGANIIFEDASIDQAVEGIIQGIYFNQGHVCCAGSRLFVQESVRDEVVAKLMIRMASLRVGDPLDKNTDVGAINSREQLGRIQRYLEVGEREGAELHVPGESSKAAKQQNSKFGGDGGAALALRDLPEKGFWCRPCFFSGVQPSHVIAREEIFGPVLAVMTFRTPEEALVRANNTPYGLAAGVWTDKGSKIFEIARRLDAGVIWCNTYNKFDAASPFGGFKESGFGREGGMQGLRGYLK